MTHIWSQWWGLGLQWKYFLMQSKKFPVPSMKFPQECWKIPFYEIETVLLPRGRIQEIKHMTLVNFTYGLFLTCTQNLIIFTIVHFNIYKMYSISPNSTPCIINKRTLLYLLGEPASLLVVTNTHPSLSLVCQELPHPFTPHSSNYIIYIDDINNLGRPHLGHPHW